MEREQINQIRAKIPRYGGLALERKDIEAFRVIELLAGAYDKGRGGFERYICAAEKSARERSQIRATDSGNGYTIPPAIFHGRNIVAGTYSDGGYLVDDETVPMAFAEYLYTKSVVVSRATLLTDMRGNLSIGQESGKLSVVWGAETSEATESQSTFSAVSLSPKELKVTTPVSKFLMNQSDPSAENLVRMCMMSAFAEAFDNKILYGESTGEIDGLNQIDRIKNSPYAGKITYDANGSLYRDILTPACEAIGKANAADDLTWLLGWEFHSKACHTAALLENGRLLFIPFEASTSVSNKDAWLGNWEYLVAAIWGGMEIVVDTTSQLHKHICRVVGHYRVDSGVLHEDAFAQVTPEV